MYAFRLRGEQMKQVIYNDGRRINIKVIPTRPYYEEQSLCVFGGWGFDEERKKKETKETKKNHSKRQNDCGSRWRKQRTKYFSSCEKNDISTFPKNAGKRREKCVLIEEEEVFVKKEETVKYM